MAFDPGAILELPGDLRETLNIGRCLDRHLSVQEMPPFGVAFVGPMDGGQSALVRALLRSPAADIPALAERPGREVRVPVEYVFGQKTRLLLGLGDNEQAPERWVQVSRDDAKALARRDICWVRVESPSAILGDWHLRFIDYPSIEEADELAQERFGALSQPHIGTLYVVPGRGLTDVDVQALEYLGRGRVAVIEGIREEELLPTRSVLGLVDLPQITCPFVLPIVVSRIGNVMRDQGAPEQDLLRLCVALLRSDAMVQGQLARYRKRVELARSNLRHDVTARLTKIQGVRKAVDPIEQLWGVVGALALEREAQKFEPFDRSLSKLLISLERSQAASTKVLRALIRRDVTSLIDQYNVEAGQRSTHGGPSLKRRTGDFGAQYVEAREELIAILENIVEHNDLNLTRAERESLTELIKEVRTDRVEIALLGRFSSGKSSLINALLGVPVDDRAPKLLPTSVRPETATVNRIEYTDGPAVLRQVSWLERVALTFLSETTESGRFRVHIDEIKAFRSWIERREVTYKQCSFSFMEPPMSPAMKIRRLGRRTLSPQQAFDGLWNSLGFPDHARPFAYVHTHDQRPTLPGETHPVSVDIAKFDNPATGWPKAPTLRQAFDAVKENPGIALRVGTLNIGFEHPLLQHATIIDTPGTDAPIPHHRKVAREIIKDKGCPVLYCFLGTCPGGLEDRENLRLLKEWGIGKTDLLRFFFVITMKGQLRAEDHTEVMAAVKENLANVGIRSPQLYFTEVVQEQNEDFHALKSAVGRFIGESRGSLFDWWLGRARRIVDDARSRYMGRLKASAANEDIREERERDLKSEKRALKKIHEGFENSDIWGVPWVWRRQGEALRTPLVEIDRLINGLTAKEEFEGLEGTLSERLDELNTLTRTLIVSLSEGLSGKLKSLLSENCSGRKLDARTRVSGDVCFQSAGVLEATGRATWRGFFKKIWNILYEDWDSDIAVNRERIAASWSATRKAGITAVESNLASTLKHLESELCRIEQGIDSELDQCRESESPERVKLLNKRVESASAWLRRLDALGRKHKKRVGYEAGS